MRKPYTGIVISAAIVLVSLTALICSSYYVFSLYMLYTMMSRTGATATFDNLPLAVTIYVVLVLACLALIWKFSIRLRAQLRALRTVDSQGV